ncbi:hypothetical protein [Cupriavidus sp. H19C3]|uniref:hypothetical protein n=1 Tax=Cupriavidus sp. H19C3 TaxID=3241603 RepID=UPI003BF86877
MPKVTFTGEGRDDPDVITFRGVEFKRGVPVTVSQAIADKLAGNHHFKVSGASAEAVAAVKEAEASSAQAVSSESADTVPDLADQPDASVVAQKLLDGQLPESVRDDVEAAMTGKSNDESNDGNETGSGEPAAGSAGRRGRRANA